MRILITGADGFVGGSILRAAIEAGYEARGSVRKQKDTTMSPLYVETGDLVDIQDWGHLLRNVDVIVHAAGAVHSQNVASGDAENFYNQVNFETTMKMAHAASKSGIRKFIFLSSASVYGANNGHGLVDEETEVSPSGFYGASKRKAEIALSTLADSGSMEIVILRPAMIFGTNCPGNFPRLVKLVKLGLPLPFAGLDGLRTFLHVDDLNNLLLSIFQESVGPSGIYNVASADTLSLVRTCEGIAKGVGRPLKIFNISKKLLFIGGPFSRVSDVMKKLDDSLIMSVKKAEADFSWTASTETYKKIVEVANTI
ncbi:NAD-dependent epimerase/dehydratase family protein [Granulosicoccus antarcticus]|uniref:N-acetyl-alpha-D-glucosaminyl-diphospho-ditrans, octacis-undecaprenol 4-epimerase n=1 Tax=Granulosicoccus antarcticus IMCC3135 TaxID=1192854 RepID=A0A2Z2NTK8_9GAMM|nr:NAD-dependent epimerase/dehydratase family protein [Granulosicoccus antarcticus]ASJ74603.1 N-acetyl-alpha-D-glucosaminyl-diphospho-ditrans,octacis-undecaprenol 4-epimerase [Granulosicoccus antarcticus IMCC3135]